VEPPPWLQVHPLHSAPDPALDYDEAPLPQRPCRAHPR
jgi:hypothetical protein